MNKGKKEADPGGKLARLSTGLGSRVDAWLAGEEESEVDERRQFETETGGDDQGRPETEPSGDEFSDVDAADATMWRPMSPTLEQDHLQDLGRCVVVSLPMI